MRARFTSSRGGSLIEIALFIPLILTLMVGMEQLGRITYTYYTLRKIVYTAARYVGTQQGVNFCDAADATVTAAKNYAVTGTTDASVDPFIPGLTPDMLDVRIERYDPVAQSLDQCDCSVTGCDASQGGQAPDFVVVSIPDGYPFLPRIPFLTQIDPIPLKPQVRVPFGGT